VLLFWGAKNNNEKNSPDTGEIKHAKRKAMVANTILFLRNKYKNSRLDARIIEFTAPCKFKFHIVGMNPTTTAIINAVDRCNPKCNQMRNVNPTVNEPQRAVTKPEGQIVRDRLSGKI